LKIIDTIDRGAWADWGLPSLNQSAMMKVSSCTISARMFGVRTFDFLIDEEDLPRINKEKIDLYTVEVTDYFQAKQCILEGLKYYR
jgi:hypothetical protein